MTAAVPDPRNFPYPLGRRCCGAPDATACHQRGLCWMEGVHPDSPGYRDAAAPDPRFRDQLAEESGKHRPNYTGEPWPWGDGATYVGCVCGWLREGGASFEQHRADALMPAIAAEVEARVQAAALDAKAGR